MGTQYIGGIMTSEKKEDVADKYFLEMGIMPETTDKKNYDKVVYEPINYKNGRPLGSKDKQIRKKRPLPLDSDNEWTDSRVTRKAILKRLKKYDNILIEDLKNDLRFTEEYLYDLIRQYRLDKNMIALLLGLDHIVKARIKRRYAT